MREIESIKILYPEVMKAGADKAIRKKLQALSALKIERASLFEQATEVERKIKEINTELDALKGLYEVTYKETEPKEFVNGVAPAIVESNGTIHIGE